MFRNGAAFLYDVFEDRPALAEAVNRLLVVGFYMLNLGYAFYLLRAGKGLDAFGAVQFFVKRLSILLVTLDKPSVPAEHKYEDRFLSEDLFQWQSQNRQHREGKVEQKLAQHVQLGIPVHLFVRKTAKTEGRAAPFLYCGTCEFVDWEGDRPITITFRLQNRVPERWRTFLGLPSEDARGPGQNHV